jgi:hypothetical protein
MAKGWFCASLTRAAAVSDDAQCPPLVREQRHCLPTRRIAFKLGAAVPVTAYYLYSMYSSRFISGFIGGARVLLN